MTERRLDRRLGHTGKHVKGFDLVTFDQVAATPAEALAHELTAELLRAKTTNACPFFWNDGVFAIANGNGEVIALICWRKVDFTRSIFVGLGGVHPAYRRRGLYSALWNAFAANVRATRPDVVSIDSGFGVDNVASEAMHQKLGRAPVGVMATFRLVD